MDSDPIWVGLAPFHARAQRQAADYVALVRALAQASERDSITDEFLHLDEFVRSCGERGSDVHGDPYARLWTRIAFSLSRARRRREPVPPEAEPFARNLGLHELDALFRCHLEEFKRLAIGAALRAGRDLRLTTPLRPSLPAALPGAAAALEGEGTVAIHGISGGRIETDRGWLSPTPCPRVRVGELDLPLQPHGYAVPALDWRPPAADTDLAYQASRVPLARAGFQLLARHVPTMFEQMCAVLRWIALNPMSSYTGTNYVSFSELPGAFAFRAVPNPYSAAEACIHEFHHNRLFALEEQERLVADVPGASDLDAIYYSPWRDEPRPIRGLLHAVYVTVAQTRFWLSVYEAPETSVEVRRFATDQLIRHPMMIELGMAQIERFAPLTEAGERFVAALRRTIHDHGEETRRLRVPSDAPLHVFHDDGSIRPAPGPDGPGPSVREVVDAHLREFDTRHQIVLGPRAG